MSHSVAFLITKLHFKNLALMLRQTEPASGSLMKCDQEFIDNLVRVLDRHYTNPSFNISSMAAEMCISERQLQRKVKVLTGKSPIQYLREFRLNKSLNHLRESVPVGNVAKLVGFTSHAYFTSCFNAHFGLTPRQLQDQSMRITRKKNTPHMRRERPQRY